MKCSFSQTHRVFSLPWNLNSFDLEERPFLCQANSCLSLGLSCAAVSLPSSRGPRHLPSLLPHTPCGVLSPLVAPAVQPGRSLVTRLFPMRLHALQRAGTESAFCHCVLSARPGGGCRLCACPSGGSRCRRTALTQKQSPSTALPLHAPVETV